MYLKPFPYRSAFALLLAGTLVSTGCKKDEEDPVTPTTPTADNIVVVDQPIATNTNWTADKKYLVKGFIEVENGVTLTIAPGTVVLGHKATKGTLIINRGAKLDAVGTPTQPIVFTSAEPAGSRAPGDWGGIIMCGRAPINLAGGTGVVEGGVEAVFGGNDPADNSGRLKYVRIEFPGIAFQENNEINGLTLAGVGSGTEIDHVQVSYSGDDSFEWFGGTVNNKYLVAFAGLDDDFDMDNGYSGKLQFGVVLRHPNQADISGSNGLEHDNDANGSSATPFTSPVITNISIFGPLATSSTTINSNYKRANHLRRNTHTKVFNSVFAGFPTGLLIDGSACEANADAGDLKVRNNVYSGVGTLTAVVSGSTWNISSFFTSNGNTQLTNNSELGVVDAFNLSSPNFTLTSGSILATGASFTDTEVQDGFFTTVPYKGAFGTEDWTAGWTNWDPQNTTY